MRQYICASLILISLFFSTNSFGQNKIPSLTITHLTGDFYAYTTFKDSFPSNSIYLVTNEGVVLFDTLWDSTQFQPLLDSIDKRHQKKAIMCLVTHYHDDRTAGLDFFKQKRIKTYPSKQTLDLCRQHHEKQAEYYFTKNTSFKIGNYSFITFYPGEGHTKDNIIIWFANDKIIYGGYLVKSTESKTLGNIADANLSAWPQTIKNIMRKFHDPRFVIPGHFGWTNNGLEHTLKLLQEK